MIVLRPAYGRKYTSFEEALRDWINGLDFKIKGGPYCSIKDVDRLEAQFGEIYFDLHS